MTRAGARFSRVEPRRRARAFVLGLLAELPRKNCWTIAEHAGDRTPDGMQHLLSRARWDAEDRRRRNRRLCPCQLRAGELCACAQRRRFLICSGAASRRGLPYGGSTRFYGGSTRRQGSSGPVYRAAAAVRGLAGGSGRLSPCFPDAQASCCGCRGPARRAARSRLTALAVSAGHMPGPVGQAGAAASFRLRNAGPAGPCRVSLEW